MPKKRILYLVTLSEWGGAQKYVFDLAAHFASQGHDVCVAVGGDKNGELIKKLLQTDIKTYYIKKMQRQVNFYNDWFAFWALIKLFRKVKPDIAHLNSSKAGALGGITAKIAGVKKIIYTVHGLVLNEPLGPLKKNFYRLAEWFSAIFKNKIICVSRADYKSVIAFNVAAAGKLTVIHNGIDLSKLHFLAKEDARLELEKIISRQPGLANQQLSTAGCQLIGTIADLYPSKGLAYLLEAARETLFVNQDLKYVIIGEGPERKKLEHLIAGYKLSANVFLSGRLAEAARYLRAFDLFVLSSVKEGLAYSLIEAAAAGLPIIASNVGGNPEIIKNQENGILIPAKNFSRLAETIINILNNAPQRSKLAQKAQKDSNRFSLAAMLRATEKIYET